MKSILKRIKDIEKIIEASSDPDDMRAYLKELLPDNKKSLAELYAEFDAETLRAIADSDDDETEEIFINAVRALQKGGKS